MFDAVKGLCLGMLSSGSIRVKSTGLVTYACSLMKMEAVAGVHERSNSWSWKS